MHLYLIVILVFIVNIDGCIIMLGSKCLHIYLNYGKIGFAYCISNFVGILFWLLHLQHLTNKMRNHLLDSHS